MDYVFRSLRPARVQRQPCTGMKERPGAATVDLGILVDAQVYEAFK